MVNGMKLLVTGDWHLRADKPRCRTDEDWALTQAVMMRQVVRTANKYSADLCIIGDIFHTPVVPPWVVSSFIRAVSCVKKNVYILAGNHDLPYHSWQNVDQSSFGILWETISQGKIRSLSELGYAPHFGQEEEMPQGISKAFLHTLTFQSEGDLPPGVKAKTAQQLLDELPYPWIFTSDNHRAFHYEKDKRHVINPGCLIRQAIDFRDYKPMVYFVDTVMYNVQPIELLENTEMVDDAYIKEDKERKARIEAFVEAIRGTGTVSLDFKANLENGMKDLEDDVVDTLKKLIMEVAG